MFLGKDTRGSQELLNIDNDDIPSISITVDRDLEKVRLRVDVLFPG